MLRGYLRGGASRDLVSNPAPLQHDDRQTGAGEEIGRRQANDAAADNADVDGA
jgi:hypothetical protein